MDSPLLQSIGYSTWSSQCCRLVSLLSGRLLRFLFFGSRAVFHLSLKQIDILSILMSAPSAKCWRHFPQPEPEPQSVPDLVAKSQSQLDPWQGWSGVRVRVHVHVHARFRLVAKSALCGTGWCVHPMETQVDPPHIPLPLSGIAFNPPWQHVHLIFFCNQPARVVYQSQGIVEALPATAPLPSRSSCCCLFIELCQLTGLFYIQPEVDCEASNSRQNRRTATEISTQGKRGNLYPVKCGLIVFCMPNSAKKGMENGERWPQINGQTAVKTLKHTRDICLNVANFG